MKRSPRWQAGTSALLLLCCGSRTDLGAWLAQSEENTQANGDGQNSGGTTAVATGDRDSEAERKRPPTTGGITPATGGVPAGSGGHPPERKEDGSGAGASTLAAGGGWGHSGGSAFAGSGGLAKGTGGAGSKENPEVVCTNAEPGSSWDDSMVWGRSSPQKGCAWIEKLPAALRVVDISSDGSTLIGQLPEREDAPAECALRWRRGDALQCLGSELSVSAVSDDGTWIAATETVEEGRRPVRISKDAAREILWYPQEDEEEAIGVFGTAVSISGDGNTIVGNLGQPKPKAISGTAFRYHMDEPCST